MEVWFDCVVDISVCGGGVDGFLLPNTTPQQPSHESSLYASPVKVEWLISYLLVGACVIFLFRSFSLIRRFEI